METKETSILDLGNIDFTPDWAKKAAGVSRPAHFRDEQGDGGGHATARPQKFDGRGPADGKPRQDRDRRGFGPGAPRDRRSSPGGRDGRNAPPERIRPLDVDVKVLPESKALGTIMRKLMQSPQAYKLKDLAYFLLDNPETVQLKIVPRAKPEASGGEERQFFQCKACSFAAPDKEDVAAHILGAHLGDYYEAREIEVEPPKGNFNCVAKCGLTGVLLGPPNVHEFNSVVREILRTKFPNMSEADYRSRIVMVREPEAVEEWRKGATKKTVYVAKGAGENAPQLTREQAESEFRRNILDNLLDRPKTLMITAAVALKSECKPLVWAVRDALKAEERAPYGMLYALRGAFHHRKMAFFRANDARGPEFVLGHEIKEFDAAHAIPELAKVARFIQENPCCTRQEIASVDPDAEKQLAWLVSTGHVVSFTNGVYSAVEKYPKYGPQWVKRAKKNAPSQPESAPPQPEEGANADESATPPAAGEAPCPPVETAGEAPCPQAEEPSVEATPPSAAEPVASDPQNQNS